MKKIFLILLLFVSFMNVEAKDYEVMELIPIDEKASVTTNLFFYDNFYYDSSEEQASYLNTNTIRFDKVKNLDSKDRDISVAIGFFNSNKDNIGIHNYCSSKDVMVESRREHYGTTGTVLPRTAAHSRDSLQR